MPAGTQALGQAAHTAPASVHNGRTKRREAAGGAGDGKGGLGGSELGADGSISTSSKAQSQGLNASFVGGKPAAAAPDLAFKPGSMPPAPSKPGMSA